MNADLKKYADGISRNNKYKWINSGKVA